MKHFNDIGDNRDENHSRSMRKRAPCSVNNEDLLEGSTNFLLKVVAVYCSSSVYFLLSV